MRARVGAGTSVQTPFGKGVVREVQNSGRLLVDVQGRSLVVRDVDISVLTEPKGTRSRAAGPRVASAHASESFSQPSRQTVGELDLHGLTVEDEDA